MYPTRRGRAASALGAVIVLAVTMTLAACSPRSAEGLYAQAVAKAKAGDVPGSMIDLKNALQKRSDFGPARRLLGELYLRTGDPLSAVNELTRAQKSGQSAAVVTPLIFRAQLDAGRFAEALKAMSKMSADRMDAQMWALRGEALAAIGDYKSAAAALGASLARDPNNADAHLSAARLAWAGNDVAGAKREYASAVRFAPGSVRGWLLKGEFEISTGQVQAAVASFNKALAKSFGVDKTKARLGLARCMLIAKDLDGADRQVQAVLRQSPDLPMAHYLAAYVEVQRQNWDAAEDHLLQVLKNAPDHLQSLFLKGAVNAEQKKYLQAEVALTRVIAVAPEDLKARKLLASVYMRQGEAAKAVAVLEVAQPASASDAQYQSLLGGALMNSGQVGKAVSANQKALQLAPETGDARMQLALSRLVAGDAAGATEDLRAAAMTKEGGDRALRLLVVALLRQGKFDAALVEIARLKKLKPDDPESFNLAAAVWISRHDQAKAEAELQAALRLNPKFIGAKMNLARMALVRKDVSTAMRLYAEARTDDPRSIDPVLGLAALEYQRKNEKAAIALLEEARAKWRDIVEPRIMLARLYVQQGQYARAEAPAREAVELKPASVEAASLYGKALLGQKKSRAALDVLERVAPRAASDANLQYDLALARAAVGDIKGGSEAADKAVTDSDRTSVPALVLSARLAMAQNRTDDARRSVARIHDALRKNGSVDAQATLALLDGDMAYVQNQWPAAVANYSHALALKPTTEAVVRLSRVLNVNGQGSQARATLNEWLKAHPGDAYAKSVLAELQMTSGQNAEAIRSYQALASTESNDHVVYNNLAWLQLNGNDVVRGLANAEKAYALAPDNPDVMDTVAWLRFKSGNKKDEVVQLLQSSAAARKNPEVRYHLAEVFAAQGKMAAARTELDGLLAGNIAFASKPAALALRQKIKI